MRNLEGTGPVLFSIDAKQRAIIANYRTYIRKNGGIETTELTRRFCSEPSPDVFSVLAQSLGAGGSFGKSGDPVSIEAAFNLAYSGSEQGSTIPRTQTVNLLRELMFRTCERYVSGGYSETELSIQAVRDQRLIVSILAIESLTGAVTPKPVVVGLTGSAGAGATGEAIVRLDDARQRRDKADKAAASAADDYTKENVDGVCDAIKGKKETDLTDAQKTKVVPCNKVRDARSAAQQEQGAARDSYSELSQMARTGGVTAQTVASSVNATGGGLDRAGGTGDVTEVAKSVQHIVDRNFNDDTEVMLFCLKALGPDQSGLNIKALEPICLAFLQTKVVAASNLTLAEMEGQIARAKNEFGDLTRTNFERFWSARGGEFSDPVKRDAIAKALATKMLAPDHGLADCFRQASTRDAVAICFGALTIPYQNELLK